MRERKVFVKALNVVIVTVIFPKIVRRVGNHQLNRRGRDSLKFSEGVAQQASTSPFELLNYVLVVPANTSRAGGIFRSG